MNLLDEITVGQALRDAVATARTVLRESGVENWRYEAIWLACHAFGVNQSEIYTADVTQSGQEAYKIMVQKRAARYPLQYLLGAQEFMGREFIVGEGVLIPRPDTQSLVETVVEMIGGRCLRVLDLCTGSGCIAISVKLARPDCEISASDVSGDALAFARENAKRLSADVTWIRGDMFENITGRYDIITCNPPYIRTDEGLQPEIGFEPEIALYGGADGLDFYRILNESMGGYLVDGGIAVLECGDHQAGDIRALLSSHYATQAYSDMFGGLRIIVARKI